MNKSSFVYKGVEVIVKTDKGVFQGYTVMLRDNFEFVKTKIAAKRVINAVKGN